MYTKRVWGVIVALVVLGGAILVVTSRKTPGAGGGWEHKVRAALKTTPCVPAPEKRYGTLRYDGPLIDTHYHIPHLDNPPPLVPDGGRPYMGDNITISDIVCTIQQEQTRKVFAFFPVFPGGHTREFLDVASGAVTQHPNVFVPFIMPPERDNNPEGYPTVRADALREMLNATTGFFQGYGEIGLYARPGGAEELPPDAPRLREIYPVIREHTLAVYFHLGEGQQGAFERMVAQHWDINFIFHGDQLVIYGERGQDLRHIDEILRRNPNVFYTVDELYGDEWLIKPDVTKEQFLAHLENYNELLEEDLGTWKGIIERYPNQFLWGTDRSDQVRWSHDPDVGQALTGYARAFIARLDPAVQERFAYKNAERVITK